MATTQTTRQLTRGQARTWMDGMGFCETRLPKRGERAEIVTPSYSQFDLICDGKDSFRLVSTRLTN